MYKTNTYINKTTYSPKHLKENKIEWIETNQGENLMNQFLQTPNWTFQIICEDLCFSM